MKIIALASRKGGAGKSTLAAHLAVLADRPDRRALLVDIDSQGSLHFWWELRSAETPLLVACPAQELAPTLDAARADGIGYVFVDAPPHNAPALTAMMRMADLTIIPVRPAAFDLAAASATIALARDLGRRHLVVLNACPPRRGIAESGLTAEARQAVAAMGAPVWSGSIGQRAALSHAIASGQAVHEFDPHGKAARELGALWGDVEGSVNQLEAA